MSILSCFNKKFISKEFIRDTAREFFITAAIVSVALMFIVQDGDFSPDDYSQYLGAPFLLSSSFVMFAINTVFRLHKAKAKWHLCRETDTEKRDQHLKTIAGNECICALFFAVLNTRLILGIITSLGALLLFNDPHPVIGIYGDSYCDSSASTTALGTFFTDAGIDPTTVLAGLTFLTSLFFAFILPRISSRYQEKNRELHQCVQIVALCCFARMVVPLIYHFLSDVGLIPDNPIDYFFVYSLKDSSFLYWQGLSYGAQLGIIAASGIGIFCITYLIKNLRGKQGPQKKIAQTSI